MCHLNGSNGKPPLRLVGEKETEVRHDGRAALVYSVVAVERACELLESNPDAVEIADYEKRLEKALNRLRKCADHNHYTMVAV